MKDDSLLFKECRTLAPKLGFKDSASLVHYFYTVYDLISKIKATYPNLNADQIKNAVSIFNAQGPTNLYTSPCTDQAVGIFISTVYFCAALAATPIIGAGLAGGCMIGALVYYTGALASCQ